MQDLAVAEVATRSPDAGGPAGGPMDRARALVVDPQKALPVLATAIAFALLFANPASTLARDLWTNPDAGHGLLLIPLAGWLAWKRGIAPNAAAQPYFGATILLGAIVLRYVSGLAAELFTMRFSMFMAAIGLIVFYKGVRQVLHWWLPTILVFLSIPLPVVVLGSLALPLQFQASRIGAALLEWRHVPVLLNGNVMQIPGQTLFVTEACSGLRSLSALIALGVLIGGLWLRYPVSRVLLLALTIPVAILLNGVRVFLTGFLVFFVDPKLGEGFMHMTEGWIIFVVAFAILGATSWAMLQGESLFAAWRARRAS
ncbi:MAG TPA: exosortase/archaeosortase family protein [Longimicrobiales bacterium]|nr:exosortase/archaeosortase family protein [Longimicrobiales bacterium]